MMEKKVESLKQVENSESPPWSYSSIQANIKGDLKSKNSRYSEQGEDSVESRKADLFQTSSTPIPEEDNIFKQKKFSKTAYNKDVST